MDAKLYALLNKKIKSVASGIASHYVIGTSLYLTFTDGTTATITFPSPKDGISVERLEIDEDTLELKYFLSDGTSGIAGIIPKGKDGATPKINSITNNWEVEGKDTGVPATGPEGFSPSIKENENNNSNVYKLDITNKDGTFTTPNLKGTGGSGDLSDYYTKEETEQLIQNNFVALTDNEIQNILDEVL